jgi:transposase-like protein
MIKGERHYLWRAVDQEGNVLDILVQRRRDKKAAKKFFRKLLKGLTYVPLAAPAFRQELRNRFQIWQAIMASALAA